MNELAEQEKLDGTVIDEMLEKLNRQVATEAANRDLKQQVATLTALVKKRTKWGEEQYQLGYASGLKDRKKTTPPDDLGEG